MASIDRIDTALVEELLYGSEGVDLDFKRDQYHFEGASDLDKAELLKDVLAFANAFRRSDAFILVGVEEGSGGRANVVGVAHHLKDADLQQFVNTKTNRNIVFSYHAIEVEGKQIGMIRIQEQQRPIFLKKDFGHDPVRNRHRLGTNVVYFRVGSSTKEATPEDIARMGSHSARQPVYDVELQFANFRDKTVTGNILKTAHAFLFYDGEMYDYTTRRHSDSRFGMAVALPQMDPDNRDFWREAYNYITHWNTLAEVGFCIANRGDTTIDDVTVEMVFATDDRFVLVAEGDMPPRPKPRLGLYHFHTPNFSVRKPAIRVEKRGDKHVVTLWFGKIQAGQRQFLPDALYIGNPLERQVIIDAVIRADQFPSPLTARLEFHAQGTMETVKWDELKAAIEDEFFRTKEDD
ncbi:MAG: hypothetical protein JWL69_4323 [Phycisphaerales bacterium]|jgi:hypothetical protein|nr:hypothetical protein [Phycisphaerales bacterium]MDB5334167.1 hypothetical protein [Phycisphaerales bacterium]